MKQLPKTIKIGNDVWRIRRGGKDVLGERLGACVHETKTIWIFDTPEHDEPENLFATLTHEIIHARNKRISEKATVETEAAICAAREKIFGKDS